MRDIAILVLITFNNCRFIILGLGLHKKDTKNGNGLLRMSKTIMRDGMICYIKKASQLLLKGFFLVAGAGLEPTTSGL